MPVMTDTVALGLPDAVNAPSVKFNTWARVAIVAAFVCAPVGLFCGASAFRQIRERHERGMGMAVSAMVVGGLGTLIAMFMFVAATGVFSSAPQCAYSHLAPAPSGQHWVCRGDSAHTVANKVAAQ
jgi:hypothetical protein